MSKSAIGWTEETWNPVTGCSKVSPGCDHCYAETMTRRLRAMGVEKYAFGFDRVVVHEAEIERPLRWRRPRLVFVNSMSDLFHPAVPVTTTRRLFDVMSEADSHVFQILTKRPKRMVSMLAEWGPVPAHIWLGVSVELNRYAYRTNYLSHIDTDGVRFVSAEPLLGPLPALDVRPLDWVIVGGESGPGHRPINPDWVRDLRDRSLASHATAFFFKQWGGLRPTSGGRELDGRTWDEMPPTGLEKPE